MSRVPGWAKVVLFLSSYAPLYIIVALRGVRAEYELLGFKIPNLRVFGEGISLFSLSMIALTLTSILFLILMLQFRRTRQGQQSKIERFRSRSDMYTEYLLVYIFPFIVFDFSNMYDVAAFAVLFFTVAVIVIQSNRLFTNPILSLMRYKIYEIETEQDTHLLLSKERLDSSYSAVNAVRITNDVFITTK